MALVGTDLVFELKDFQAVGATQVLNVYHYVGTGLGDYPAEDVVRAVEAALWDEIRQELQHTTYSHLTVECVQVNVDDNFFEGPSLIGAGLLVGNPMPNYTAAAFQLNRATRETRNGQKRISGGTETDVSQNQWEAAYLTKMDAVAVIMGGTINVVGSGDLDPIILSKRRDEFGVLLDPALWVYNFVSSATANGLLKTQVTRLLGRGV